MTTWSSFYGKINLDLFYVLKYEDLWDDTAGQLNFMFNSLSLPYNNARLASACSLSRSKILAARQSFDSRKVLNDNFISFQRRGGHGSWKETLNDTQIKLIADHSVSVMQKFGYTFSL